MIAARSRFGVAGRGATQAAPPPLPEALLVTALEPSPTYSTVGNPHAQSVTIAKQSTFRQQLEFTLAAAFAITARPRP